MMDVNDVENSRFHNLQNLTNHDSCSQSSQGNVITLAGNSGKPGSDSSVLTRIEINAAKLSPPSLLETIRDRSRATIVAH